MNVYELCTSLRKAIRSLRRATLGTSSPVVLEAEAIEIAVSEFERRGWGCSHPRAIQEAKAWKILADSNSRSSPWVVVDQQSGEVVSAGVPRR
jgi:hypothetical protein